MKKMLVCVLLCLLGVTSALSEAALNMDEMTEFAYNNSAYLPFRAKDAYTVRAVYEISLPPDLIGIDEAVTTAYQPYEHIYLVEYGYQDFGPITQSYFECIGIKADGAMEIAPTPFYIVARTYDYAVFDHVTIVALE